MKCPKCGLEMFVRPKFVDGVRIPQNECKNKQCENYKPDKKAETQENS
jgi:hypothetical protein